MEFKNMNSQFFNTDNIPVHQDGKCFYTLSVQVFEKRINYGKK